MPDKTQENFWQGALSKWLAGAIYAPIKIIGPHQVKVMTRAMALVFTNFTLKEEVSEETLGKMQVSDDESVISEFCNIEQKSGLIENTSDVEVLPSGDALNMKFHGCPYGKLCNETLATLLARGDFNKKSIPCLRIETYSACLSLTNRSRRPYKLIQFAPGAVCECALEPQRQRR